MSLLPTSAALMLLCLVPLVTVAGDRVPRPQPRVEPGTGKCIAPPAEMRRNHMDMLKHQRDRTVRAGERGAKVSLNGCIDCHAGKETGSVATDGGDFCNTCHAYAAVKLDCFECHQPKVAPARSASGARP